MIESVWQQYLTGVALAYAAKKEAEEQYHLVVQIKVCKSFEALGLSKEQSAVVLNGILQGHVPNVSIIYS